MSVYSLDKLMSEARRIAAEYRRVTGKTLGGLSSEIAQHDAARLLGLELRHDVQGGYDALGRGERSGRRIQIKGRAIFDERKQGQRIGQLKLDQEWDSVMLVLMDEQFQPTEIYEADRAAILDALDEGGSRARRGAMSVSRFKVIGRLAWTVEGGREDDEIWENRPDVAD